MEDIVTCLLDGLLRRLSESLGSTAAEAVPKARTKHLAKPLPKKVTPAVKKPAPKPKFTVRVRPTIVLLATHFHVLKC